MNLEMYIVSLLTLMWAVTYVFSFFTKLNHVNCGLTAYCGPVAPNLDKLKIIALFNESRGKDSCGILIDDHLSHGVSATKNAKISDYLQQFFLGTPGAESENFNVMIHTRKATYGAHTAENAHPFRYINEDGDTTMYFMHNGTISNWYSLCAQHGIDNTKFSVDSKAIGAIINKERDFKVFSEYKGAGAFIWYDPREKNKMYVFKGGAGDKEERPLYYWRDPNTGGVYISSMMEPLLIIDDAGSECKEFKLNNVYTIDHGTILPATVKVKRSETLHENYVEPTSYGKQHTQGQLFTPVLDDVSKRKSQFLFLRGDGLTFNIEPDGFAFKAGRYYGHNDILLHGRYKLDWTNQTVEEWSETAEKDDDLKDAYAYDYFFAGIHIRRDGFLRFQTRINEKSDFFMYEMRDYVLQTFCEPMYQYIGQKKANFFQDKKLFSSMMLEHLVEDNRLAYSPKGVYGSYDNKLKVTTVTYTPKNSDLTYTYIKKGNDMVDLFKVECHNANLQRFYDVEYDKFNKAWNTVCKKQDNTYLLHSKLVEAFDLMETLSTKEKEEDGGSSSTLPFLQTKTTAVIPHPASVGKDQKTIKAPSDEDIFQEEDDRTTYGVDEEQQEPSFIASSSSIAYTAEQIKFYSSVQTVIDDVDYIISDTAGSTFREGDIDLLAALTLIKENLEKTLVELIDYDDLEKATDFYDDVLP